MSVALSDDPILTVIGPFSLALYIAQEPVVSREFTVIFGIPALLKSNFVVEFESNKSLKIIVICAADSKWIFESLMF